MLVIYNFAISDEEYDTEIVYSIVENLERADEVVQYAHLSFGVRKENIRFVSIEPYIEDGQEIVDGDEDLPF